MAFTHVESAQNNGTATNGTITLAAAPSSGDLVVAYVNRNGTDSISIDAAGSAWTEVVNEIPSGETGRQAQHWKIAGASESATITWTFGSSDSYQVIVKVFSSLTDAEVDSAINTTRDASKSSNMVVEAVDGAVISDDAVSLVFCGKDTRPVGGTYTTADNSYVSVTGVTDDQDSASAHRIYTTGTTFSGSITINDAGPSTNDNTYSTHMSFVESAGGPTGNPWNYYAQQ